MIQVYSDMEGNGIRGYGRPQITALNGCCLIDAIAHCPGKELLGF